MSAPAKVLWPMAAWSLAKRLGMRHPPGSHSAGVVAARQAPTRCGARACPAASSSGLPIRQRVAEAADGLLHVLAVDQQRPPTRPDVRTVARVVGLGAEGRLTLRVQLLPA